MKATLIVASLLIIVVATVGIVIATGDGPGVVINTKHNLSEWGPGTIKAAPGNAWGTGSYSNAEICVFCHTPHAAYWVAGGPNENDEAPLWNHNGFTTSTFNMYYSSTMDANMVGGTRMNVPQTSNLVGYPSHACLSCHDGTMAVNALLNNAGSGVGTDPAMVNGINTIPPTSPSYMGTDLQNDHPINFYYDAALYAADNGLNNPANPPISNWLYNSTVQCSSCHSVHGTPDATFPGNVVPMLLKISNANSALCTTCHNK